MASRLHDHFPMDLCRCSANRHRRNRGIPFLAELPPRACEWDRGSFFSSVKFGPRSQRMAPHASIVRFHEHGLVLDRHLPHDGTSRSKSAIVRSQENRFVGRTSFFVSARRKFLCSPGVRSGGRPHGPSAAMRQMVCSGSFRVSYRIRSRRNLLFGRSGSALCWCSAFANKRKGACQRFRQTAYSSVWQQLRPAHLRSIQLNSRTACGTGNLIAGSGQSRSDGETSRSAATPLSSGDDS
jgi:hypothetical protein